MSQPRQSVYEFGPYLLDTAERVLLRDGKPVPLTPKAYETLVVLVENNGHVVEKDRLMREVWPDSFVEEGGLNVNIFRLRKALGETDERRYIETVPRRGYRFVAEVRAPRASGAAGSREGNEGGAAGLSAGAAAGESGERGADGGGGPGVSPAATVRGPGARRTRVGSRRLGLALTVLGLAAACALAALYLPRTRGPARPEGEAPEVTSLAVLPFETLGGAAGADAYLGQGMADALINKLSSLRQVVVRPTSAVLKYSDARPDLASVGRELKVSALLDGRIQRDGERIRVSVQLVRTRDGVPVWGASFDEQFTNIFAVQDSISEQLARALTPELTGGERVSLAKRHTRNPEAFELYIKGRYFWNKRTAEGLRKGIENFEQAVARDPAYALAYVGLADSYMLLGSGDYALMPPREAMLRAKGAAERALEMDETLAEAHTSLAFLHYVFDWDWPAAEKHFRRAIELNPNYETARHWYALFLTVTGRSAEGVEQAHRALALNPVSLIINTDLGLIYYYTRQYDRAVEQLRKTLDIEPNFVTARWQLARTYAQQGMYEEAAAELRRAIELQGRSPVFLATLGYVYGVSGRPAEARKIIAELDELSEQRYVFPGQWASVYVGLGEKERAVELFERAYDERTNTMVAMKVEPAYDSLRGEPRFQALLRRLKLDGPP